MLYMTSHEPTNSNQAVELSPWVIVTQTDQAGVVSHLAVWRMASRTPQSGQTSTAASSESSNELDALALFSDSAAAERYAEQYCAESSTSYRVKQFRSVELVAVLAECYRLGMRCAALNPSGSAAQRLFVLRDVLSAAQQKLRHLGNL